jgi:hypothetical protein
MLVLTKFLTNAVQQHGAGRTADVRVTCGEQGVEVPVGNDGGPVPQSTVGGDEHGRGLLLVANLSNERAMPSSRSGRAAPSPLPELSCLTYSPDLG